MQPNTTGTKVWQLALVVLLVYGLGLRIHALSAWKTNLSNDESVSYMCAAGTAGIWETTIADLVDRPLRVADIQRFYDRPAHLDFHTVSLDMARYDVHPPLYFWLLHVIHVLWGTTVGTGAWLNVAFGLAVLLLLYQLARQLSGSTSIALASAVVWYLSPAAVQIDLEARPYQLLALLALASYMLGQRVIHGRGDRWTWAAFIATNCLGLLTHLYFPFLLLPGLGLMLWKHGTGLPTLRYAGSLVVSLVGMLLLYPEFIEFVTTYGVRPRDVPEPVHHLARLKGLAYTTMQFFTEPHLLRYVFLGLCAVVAIRYVLKPWGSRKLIRHSARTHLFITLAWWTCFTAVLFLVGISPSQAVGEQYFAYIWPLASITCVLLIGELLKGRPRQWLFGLYLAQLALSLYMAVRGSEYLKPAIPQEWNQQIATSDLLITDEAKRTAVPRMSRALPAELPLFIMLHDPPDLSGYRRITFLHLDIDQRPVAPLYAALDSAGFRPVGDELANDRYELRSFTR